MSPQSIIDAATAAGISLYVKDNGMLGFSPKDKMTGELLAFIKVEKPAIMDLLRNRKPVLRPYTPGMQFAPKHRGHESALQVQWICLQYLPLFVANHRGQVPADAIILNSKTMMMCQNPAAAVTNIERKLTEVASSALRDARPLSSLECEFLRDAQDALSYVANRFKIKISSGNAK